MPPTVHIALAWKVISAGFCAVLIPVYLAAYGWTNFLWFSDIALFGLTLGIWLHSRLLISMMAVGMLLPELLWNLDFWGRIITGHHLTGESAYMFEANRRLLVRALSLFHVAMPVAMLYLVFRLGYDPQAVLWQTVLGIAVLLASYLLTTPQENVNWVFGPGFVQTWMPAWAWLALMSIAWPTLVYWPTHRLLLFLSW